MRTSRERIGLIRVITFNFEVSDDRASAITNLKI